MRLRLKIDKGTLVEGRDQLGALIHSLNGEYIVSFLDLNSPNTEEEWRKLYFALRDVLHDSAETGYTKNELHDAIKEKVMVGMLEDGVDDWFMVNKANVGLSTKFLTKSGWKEYMKRFREFAMDTFEIYL